MSSSFTSASGSVIPSAVPPKSISLATRGAFEPGTLSGLGPLTDVDVRRARWGHILLRRQDMSHTTKPHQARTIKLDVGSNSSETPTSPGLSPDPWRILHEAAMTSPMLDAAERESGAVKAAMRASRSDWILRDSVVESNPECCKLGWRRSAGKASGRRPDTQGRQVEKQGMRR